MNLAGFVFIIILVITLCLLLAVLFFAGALISVNRKIRRSIENVKASAPVILKSAPAHPTKSMKKAWQGLSKKIISKNNNKEENNVKK